MTEVLIFGSTGSIGKNALDVVRKNHHLFKVIGLAAYSDVSAMLSQIDEFSPRYVCLVDEPSAALLKEKSKRDVTVFAGENGLAEFAALKSELSLMAISGISALKPLLINIKYAKRIALANKEAVVTAGNLILNLAREHGTEIIPVDSEINAIFQLYKGRREDLERVYITASGGALFDYETKDLKSISASKALSHPTWNMGRRITVDSATLVNKGFEVVETHFFFGLDFQDIGIVIHRQSLVHAMLEFKDKSIMAVIYPPDMRIPISYAMFYPRRAVAAEGIDFSKKIEFSFQPLKLEQFPLLKVILAAAQKNDNALAVINAADEVLVESFLQGKINLEQLRSLIEKVFDNYPSGTVNSLEEVLHWDLWAREKTRQYLTAL